MLFVLSNCPSCCRYFAASEQLRHIYTMFFAVEFRDGSGAQQHAVVPLTWMDGKTVKWHKSRNFAKTSKQPLSTWPTYEAALVSKTIFGSFEEAETCLEEVVYEKESNAERSSSQSYQNNRYDIVHLSVDELNAEGRFFVCQSRRITQIKHL